MPKILYLDSSDYSRMGKRRPGDKSDDLYHSLTDAVHSGELEIRYSNFHLLEMTPTSVDYLEAALADVAVLESLSQGKCFRNIEEILFEQVRCHIAGQRFDKDFALADMHGFSQESFIANGGATFTQDTLLHYSCMTAIAVARNRRGEPEGSYRDLASQYLRELKLRAQNADPNWADEWFEIESMVRFVTDGLPSQRISISPSTWIKLNSRMREDGDLDSRKLITDLATKFHSDIDTYRAKVRSDAGKKKHTWDQTVASLLRELRSQWVRPYNPMLAAAFNVHVEEAKWDDALSDPEFDSCMKHLGEIFEIYMSVNHLERGSPRRIQGSDIIDLYHMMAIPYVDVFKADNNNADVARRFAERFGCLVVSDDSALKQACHLESFGRRSSAPTGSNAL